MPGQTAAPGVAPRLFGRDRERQRIDRLIDASHRRHSGALVLRGDVGTGKSALLHYAEARANDMLVLRCHAEQAESDLPFAALHQLLLPVLGLVSELPGRLAAPLAAVLAGGTDGDEPDGFLVGAATLALLARAARERPLLCVVDDGQWLDRSSADALTNAAHRRRQEGIVLLVAVRDGEGRAFTPAGVAVTWLGGLDPLSASQLVADRAGERLVPEVAQRLVEHTGGLPLALVDAVVSLSPAQLGGRSPLPEPLPVSPRLRDAVLRRVRRLPWATQRVLLLVAAAGVARIDTIARAGAELGIPPPALENAEAEGMVRIDEGGVRFRSQLVHAAVYAEAAFFERRATHLALAHALQEDDDRRAWHLAAAALTRDGTVADDLERAAEHARFRGDLSARADALQRAAQLTPDGQELGRRLATAARVCWLAGRSIEAAELLDRAGRLRLAAPDGAEIAELRGAIAHLEYDPEGARESLVAGADQVAAEQPGRALDLLLRAAQAAVARSDAGAAEDIARRARALPSDQEEGAALLGGIARVLGGRVEEASGVAERTVSMAVAAGSRGGHLIGLATALSAGNDVAPESLGSALDLLSARVGRLHAAGMAGVLPSALATQAWLELWMDRHQSALANAAEGLSLARRLAQPWAEASCAMTLAVIAAVRGHEDECADLIDLLHHPAGVQSAAVHAGAATWAAALADLSAGRFSEARGHLADLAPGRRPGHPWHALWSRPDAVEAAVRTGHVGQARAALEVLEGAARRDWPAPAAALLARSRAMLATGREAERHYLAALALHAVDERPFQQARTRLLWAEHLRRNRRRVDAREQLRYALEAFERLEVRPWAARALAELRATGETVRRLDAGRDRLTPQERRIADLVADGGSNREVAEQLYLSPRTVGYHLARIYQKLGVSSRTRLARLVREEGLAGSSDGGGQRGSQAS